MDFLYNYVTINLALLTLKFKVQQAISSKKLQSAIHNSERHLLNPPH